MTQIQRGFVSIAEGQVHFRRIQREQGRPLWMVHASPSSSLGLVGLMREFGRNRPVIAPDTLGNGDSAPAAPESPDIAYYAESSLRVMDALGIAEADLYGSHTGAHIVAEMAIAQPQRFGRVILDGIGMFSPERKREYLANYAPAITPDAFGSQIHWAWHFVRDQAWFFPYFRRDVAHLRGIDMPPAEVLHDTTVEVLKAIRTYHKAYRAAFAHPDRERLPLITRPTLVMADASDPLKTGVAEAAGCIPGARSRIFDDADISTKMAALERFLDHGDI